MTQSPSKTPIDDLLVGHVVGGRYQIEGLLGEGGVGRVYRARHNALNRCVALKVLLTEHESSETLRERFRREAEMLAALSHPHIVAVTDFGVDGEMLFLVMELLEGRTLAELLREGPIDPARGLTIVRQVLLALGYAHARDVVHRDLKPHNIFVRRLGDGADHVTVLDFGLARFTGRQAKGAQLTRTGMLIGTPAYMAPEQASGDVEAIDARTDVYAAGLLLYEVLTRRRPFLGSDPGQLLRAHLLQEPPPLSAADPGLRVSDVAQALVSRALAKSRSERFGDATEMLAALDTLDADAVRRERPYVEVEAADAESFVSAPTLAASPAAIQGQAPSAAPASPPRRSRAPMILGAIVLVLAAAGALVTGLVWMNAEPSAVAPSLGTSPPPDPPPVLPPTSEASVEVAPRVRDPFAEPLPEPLARMHAQVSRGGSLSRSQVRDVREWARENGGDPRANLVLAHSYTNERSLSWALPEYEAAMERDSSVRGDPDMLPDLFEMARSSTLTRRASDRIVEWYGADALAALEAVLEEGVRREEVSRLEALRRRLTSATER